MTLRGHAIALGGGFILRERNAALRLNLSHAERAVGAETRQNHADRGCRHGYRGLA